MTKESQDLSFWTPTVILSLATIYIGLILIPIIFGLVERGKPMMIGIVTSGSIIFVGSVVLIISLIRFIRRL